MAALGLHRLREAIHSQDRLVFFVRGTARQSDGPSPTVDLTLERATPQDAVAYARDIGTDSAETFVERLSEDTRCYVVEAEGKLLHASWVTTSASWVREIGRYFRPPPGEAYVYESFTRADARGRGVYPFALRGICDDLAAQGVEKLWVAVEADNAPSLRAVSKAGFETAFTLDYRRKLGRLRLSPPSGPMADACAQCFTRNLSD